MNDRFFEPSPLWRLRSGTFLGWRLGSDFYDHEGNRAGYFDGQGRLFRDSDGVLAGAPYPSDITRIGSQNGGGGVSSGARGTTTDRINLPPEKDAEPVGDGGWDDPLI